jgi:hypothetical protein
LRRESKKEERKETVREGSKQSNEREFAIERQRSSGFLKTKKLFWPYCQKTQKTQKNYHKKKKKKKKTVFHSFVLIHTLGEERTLSVSDGAVLGLTPTL